MKELHYLPGSTIFQIGDPSDFVYAIKQGKVELVRETARAPVTLAVIGKGEIFGEMGAIENQPRYVTARAIDDVVLEAFGPEEFLGALKRHPDAALPVIRILLARLRGASNQLMLERMGAHDRQSARDEAEKERRRIPGGRLVRVHIWPDSPYLARQMPAEGLVFPDLPLVVGRRPAPGAVESSPGVDLALEDHEPYRLALRHFSVEDREGSLIVRDNGGPLGTIVNGHEIGARRITSFEPLSPGLNDVVAGGPDSPFRFKIAIEPT